MRDIITHLYTKYGNINPQNLQENDVKMKAPFIPEVKNDEDLSRFEVQPVSRFDVWSGCIGFLFFEEDEEPYVPFLGESDTFADF